MIALLSSLGLLKWLAGALAGFVAMFAFGWQQRRIARRDGAVSAGKAYRKTRERMDDAEDDVGDDPATAARWLRERGKQ